MDNGNHIPIETIEYFNGDELAAGVFIDKYALKDTNNNLLERTPDEMFDRIASEFARIQESKYQDTKIKPLCKNDILDLIKDFKYIVPQGSPLFGIGNKYQKVSLANCFVVPSPDDSYGSIMQADENIVQISKRRGGVGIDLSKLRPEGSSTKNAARTSTGVPAFMERYSNSIREVGQSGRRGALMISIDVNHPDIEKFITIKNDRTKVTGANISIKIDDKFMNAVDKELDYTLSFDTGSEKIEKLVPAKKIWDLIIKNAWEHAEPGVLFWDTIIKNSPADSYPESGFTTISTNPCVIGDTLVLTNYGWLKIKNLQKYKEQYDDLKIVTRDKDNRKTLSELEWVGITHKDSELMKISFDNGEFLLTTPEHKLYLLDYSEKMVKNLGIGEYVIGDDLDGIRITNIETQDHKEDVWDLTANPNYNFYSILGNEDINGVTINNNGIIESTDSVTKKLDNSILSVDCGEIPLASYDSCRLLLVNLFSFVENRFTDDAYFNYSKFSSIVKIAQRLMDDLIDLEIEKIDEILSKIKSDPETDDEKYNEFKLWSEIKNKAIDGRRTGLGVTALGDCIAALNIGYGTEESLHFTSMLFKTFRDSAYLSSVEMAEDLGSFPIYSYDKEMNNDYIKRLVADNPELGTRMMKSGRRNISLLTIAPAGSISILTQTTSGFEPLFMTGYTRRKKIEKTPDSKPDFIDQNGDYWKEYKVYHPKLKLFMTEMNRTEEESPWFNYTSQKIDWNNRVRMQGIAQSFLDHSISATCNIPENTTVDIVSQIYMTAWKSGCKGMTIYRDGSRSGILVNNEESKEHKKDARDAIKRPKFTEADVHHITIKKVEYCVIVGIVDSVPYEIFVIKNADNKIGKNITKSKIRKIKRGLYSLIAGPVDYHISGFSENTDIDALTRMISLSLRHRVNISFIVQQLEKIIGFDNFPKVLARALKSYIKNGTKVSGEECPNCNSVDLARQEGCVTCSNCGWTRCS